MTTITAIRTAELADFAGIRFIDPLMRAHPDRAQLIDSSVRNGECMVAFADADILGFAVLNYSFYNQGFIPLLVVAMGNRRSGIGTRLLSEAERRCTKPKLYVCAGRSNLPAHWLFEKRGFVPSDLVANLDLYDDELVLFKSVERGLTRRSTASAGAAV
ncbi:MAG: GNAT family N-acetyltransferase [Burkholderiales bacterium]